jgi:phage terminase large subunit-like protein
MNPKEPVKQFMKWRKEGFHIKKVGHDRKFARPYVSAMKKAQFAVVDQPQLAVVKSEGFRYIEHKAKIGCLYYCHAEPFSYCVQNVRGQEKQDDVVVYDKVDPNSRIDVFDAAVFATIRMLVDTGKHEAASTWFVSNSDTKKGANSDGDI